MKAELAELRTAADDKGPTFYKQLSQKRLEQCSSFAEQLICLRNDLDKSSLNCIKMQRQHSFSTDSMMSSSPPRLATQKSEDESDLVSDNPPKPLAIQPRPTPADCSLTPNANRVDRSFMHPRPDERRRALNVSDSNIKLAHGNTNPKSNLKFNGNTNVGQQKKQFPPKPPAISHYHSNSKNSIEPKSSITRDKKH